MNPLREPLLQFLVAGGVLFSGYAWLNQGAADATVGDQSPVRIGSGELRWLRETFSSQSLRAPTSVEMDGLVETLVAEELLAREARVMGLDRGDTIVRRRLAQKLEFFVADTTRIAEPGDPELRAFYEVHRDLYQSEPKLSFEQVYFSAHQRLQPVSDAVAALTMVSSGRGDAGSLDGDPLPLERVFTEVDQRSLSGLFGADFASAVFTLPTAAWEGPVKSAFGFHLVRVTSRTAAARRPFEEVRTSVLEDWRRTTGAQTKLAYLAKLRDKYGVVIEDQRKAGSPHTGGEGQ
jgi:hypothetical protein